MVIAIVDLTTVRQGYISWSVIAGRCLPNTKQPEHQQLPGKVIELQKGTRGASLPDASHGSEGTMESNLNRNYPNLRWSAEARPEEIRSSINSPFGKVCRG